MRAIDNYACEGFPYGGFPSIQEQAGYKVGLGYLDRMLEEEYCEHSRVHSCDSQLHRHALLNFHRTKPVGCCLPA